MAAVEFQDSIDLSTVDTKLPYNESKAYINQCITLAMERTKSKIVLSATKAALQDSPNGNIYMPVKKDFGTSSILDMEEILGLDESLNHMMMSSIASTQSDDDFQTRIASFDLQHKSFKAEPKQEEKVASPQTSKSKSPNMKDTRAKSPESNEKKQQKGSLNRQEEKLQINTHEEPPAEAKLPAMPSLASTTKSTPNLSPPRTMKKNKSVASFFPEIRHKSVAFNFLDDLLLPQQQDLIHTLHIMLQESVLSLYPTSTNPSSTPAPALNTNPSMAGSLFDSAFFESSTMEDKGPALFHDFVMKDIHEMKDYSNELLSYYHELLANNKMTKSPYVDDNELTSYMNFDQMIPINFQHNVYFDEEIKLAMIKILKKLEKKLSKKYKQLNAKAQTLFESIESKFASHIVAVDGALSNWHGINNFYKSPDFTMFQVIGYLRNPKSMLKQYMLELHHPANSTMNQNVKNYGGNPGATIQTRPQSASHAQRQNHHQHAEIQELNVVNRTGNHPLQAWEAKVQKRFEDYIETQVHFHDSMRQSSIVQKQLKRFVTGQLSAIEHMHDGLNQINSIIHGDDDEEGGMIIRKSALKAYAEDSLVSNSNQTTSERKLNFFQFKKLNKGEKPPLTLTINDTRPSSSGGPSSNNNNVPNPRSKARPQTAGGALGRESGGIAAGNSISTKTLLSKGTNSTRPSSALIYLQDEKHLLSKSQSALHIPNNKRAEKSQKRRVVARKNHFYDGIDLTKATIPWTNNDLSHNEKEMITERVSVNRVRTLLRNGFTLSNIVKLQLAQDEACKGYMEQMTAEMEEERRKSPSPEPIKPRDVAVPPPILTTLFDDHIQPSKMQIAMTKEMIKLYGFSPKKAQQIFGAVAEGNKEFREKSLKVKNGLPPKSKTHEKDEKKSNAEPGGRKSNNNTSKDNERNTKKGVKNANSWDSSSDLDDAEIADILFGGEPRAVSNKQLPTSLMPLSSSDKISRLTSAEDLTTVGGGSGSTVVNLSEFLVAMDDRPDEGNDDDASVIVPTTAEVVDRLQLKGKSSVSQSSTIASTPTILSPQLSPTSKHVTLCFPSNHEDEDLEEVAVEEREEGNTAATTCGPEISRSLSPPIANTITNTILLSPEIPPITPKDIPLYRKEELQTCLMKVLHDQGVIEDSMLANTTTKDTKSLDKQIMHCQQTIHSEVQLMLQRLVTSEYSVLHPPHTAPALATAVTTDEFSVREEEKLLQDYEGIFSWMMKIEQVLPECVLEPYEKSVCSPAALYQDMQLDTLLLFVQKGLEYSNMKDHGVLFLPADVTGKRVLSAPSVRRKLSDVKKGSYPIRSSLPGYIPLIDGKSHMSSFASLKDAELESLVRKVIPHSPMMHQTRFGYPHQILQQHPNESFAHEPQNLRRTIFEHHQTVRDTVVANGIQTVLDQRLQNYIYLITKLQKGITRSYYNLLEIRMVEIVYVIVYLQCTIMKFQYLRDHYHHDQLLLLQGSAAVREPPNDSMFEKYLSKMEGAFHHFMGLIPHWNYDDYLIRKKQLQLQYFARSIDTMKDLAEGNMQGITAMQELMYSSA